MIKSLIALGALFSQLAFAQAPAFESISNEDLSALLAKQGVLVGQYKVTGGYSIPEKPMSVRFGYNSSVLTYSFQREAVHPAYETDDFSCNNQWSATRQIAFAPVPVAAKQPVGAILLRKCHGGVLAQDVEKAPILAMGLLSNARGPNGRKILVMQAVVGMSKTANPAPIVDVYTFELNRDN